MLFISTVLDSYPSIYYLLLIRGRVGEATGPGETQTSLSSATLSISSWGIPRPSLDRIEIYSLQLFLGLPRSLLLVGHVQETSAGRHPKNISEPPQLTPFNDSHRMVELLLLSLRLSPDTT